MQEQSIRDLTLTIELLPRLSTRENCIYFRSELNPSLNQKYIERGDWASFLLIGA